MTSGRSAAGETIRQQTGGPTSRAKYRANGRKRPQSKPTARRCGNYGELTMQTLNIDGTTYTLKFDKDPIQWAKAARKPWKPAKPKDLRKFPKDYAGTMSTGDYVRQFETLNNLVPCDYTELLNYSGTALYDPTMPLLEDLSDDA
jgi:hypothetical protein